MVLSHNEATSTEKQEMSTKKDYRRGQDKDKFDRKARSVKRQEKSRAFEREANEMLKQYRSNREELSTD